MPKLTTASTLKYTSQGRSVEKKYKKKLNLTTECVLDKSWTSPLFEGKKFSTEILFKNVSIYNYCGFFWTNGRVIRRTSFHNLFHYKKDFTNAAL